MDSNLKIFCTKHQEHQVLGVCFKTQCANTSRLVCFLCTLQDHEHHSAYIIELEDIHNFSTKSEQTIWPNDSQGKEIKEAIQSLETIESIQTMNTMFQNINGQLQQKLTSDATDVSRQYSTEEITRTEKFNELKGYYGAFFSLELVSNALTKLDNGGMNEVEFESIINEFVVRTRSIEFKENCQSIDEVLRDQRLLSLVQINKPLFDTTSLSLINKINELKSCFSYLSLNLGQEFFMEKHLNASVITEVEKSIRFQMSLKSALLSSKSLTTGEYNISLTINSASLSDCVVIGLVQEDQKQSSSLWTNGCPSLCITCPQLDSMHFLKTKGFTQLVYQYRRVPRRLDLGLAIQTQDLNQYKIAPKNINSEQSKIPQSYKSLPLNKQAWRLFIMKYKDGNQFDFSVNEIRWKH